MIFIVFTLVSRREETNLASKSICNLVTVPMNDTGFMLVN